jgi:hypothetical protein
VIGRRWQEAGDIFMMRSFIIVLFSKYYYIIKSRRMRWTGRVARTRECFDKKVWRKETAKRPKRSWEGNVRMDLKEIRVLS